MRKDINPRGYRNTNCEFATIPVNVNNRDIVGNNDVLVSRDGKKVLINNVEVKQKERGGYFCVDIPSCGTISVHRLSVLAWIGPAPRSSDRWLVNHIDGNKQNNHIDNLEWASYSDNIIHAYKTGLRYDNRVIWMKDLVTNEEKEFYSLQECARYLGLNGGMLYFYLKDKSKIRKGRYIFKELGEEYPEVTPEQLEKAQDSKDSLPIKVTNTETGEITYYKSTLEAAKALGVDPKTIRRRRKGVTKRNHFSSKHRNLVFEKVTDPELIEKYRGEHPCKHNAPPRKPLRIVVYNSETGETTEWDSVLSFSKHVNGPYHGIKKSIHLTGYWNQYKITYIGKKDRPDVDKRREKFYSKNNAI